MVVCHAKTTLSLPLALPYVSLAPVVIRAVPSPPCLCRPAFRSHSVVLRSPFSFYMRYIPHPFRTPVISIRFPRLLHGLLAFADLKSPSFVPLSFRAKTSTQLPRSPTIYHLPFTIYHYASLYLPRRYAVILCRLSYGRSVVVPSLRWHFSLPIASVRRCHSSLSRVRE